MIPVVVGVFAGGAAFIGVNSTASNRKRFKKRRLVEALAGKPLEEDSTTLTQRFIAKVAEQSPTLAQRLTEAGLSLEKLDNQYQRWVKRHLDPRLAGSAREQYLQELSAGRELYLSAEEKSINRQMALGAGALGLLGVGALAGLGGIVPVVIAAGLYLTLPIYRVAYEIAVKERRLSTAHLMAVYFSGMWLGGFYVVGMFGAIIGSIAQKVMMVCEDVSRYELVNIFQQQPRSVWVVVDGTEMEIPFAQLKAGDVLVMDVGHTIPVDGVIVDGIASIDQHMLTGESQPVDKGVGDMVLAATIVLGGRIFVQVEKTGEETSAAQIGEILNRSTEFQLSMEARAMKIADRSLWPMLGLGAISLPMVGMAGATAVLGSNFTLNMVWLRLLTMLNFLNVASKHRILVKNGDSLERLKQIDTVVFDKTGTLTIEQPHVIAVHPVGEHSSAEVLTLAAAAEHRQSHPVAQAIIAAAAEQQLALPSIDDAQYEVGFGIKVKLQGQWIAVGSRRFMDAENIAIPADMQTLETSCSANGHSLVYLAADGELAGILELKATTRPEAAEIVRNLHERGLQLYIISGDSELPTKALANELGIDGYFANTLPERKADLVKQLQAEGRNVCFIGDGINDAIALKQADVSVSLSGATTAATDTAQVVLMDADLQQFITLMDLSHALDDNINKNFNTAAGMSLASVGGVLFFHGGFLLVEVLAALQILVGVGIASEPLLDKDDTLPSKQPGLLGRLLPHKDEH
ncbi:heavy metal translocating P-type ATPase [Thiothrix fructosivorans]|uniref:Heavy metal translocating P-type ATPase n=1 Tax=Thiothrix fructosivorans TaxID=111770 RepID=A0A8B0SM49_9GAMM|nr:heavy metal translocating P-type ATPase [Thiothrix fructosivorans]MBO0615215.1 heavy metal translocating P-type ATPase [Thiothrix fructosivorans]QTX10002.1 heavy metal translocating P-type ATPase [Thiothrix fructosivorans]